MVIGKTSSSISKAEVFAKFSETQVLSKVFPQITHIPCRINSPLRVDKHPSFSIYMGSNNHIYYKDFGDSSEKGSLLDLLCKYWNCTFSQCLDKICAIMIDAKCDDLTVRPTIKTLTRKDVSQNTKIQVVVRPWQDYDIEYWKNYGIELKWLKYAKVSPISYKIITKKDPETGKSKRYIFPADKLAYVYQEKKDGKLQIKIYQPKNTKGFKWCSSMDGSVISLWTRVPETGDRIVICSSLKDALCLSCQLGIPAIAPQGEGYNISESACKELRRRYKKVFICFDIDEAGKKDAEALAEKTGFINVVPDLGKQKDLSDYYKSLKNKEEFKKLESYFH
jgi:hypothetical protein